MGRVKIANWLIRLWAKKPHEVKNKKGMINKIEVVNRFMFKGSKKSYIFFKVA